MVAQLLREVDRSGHPAYRRFRLRAICSDHRPHYDEVLLLVVTVPSIPLVFRQKHDHYIGVPGDPYELRRLAEDNTPRPMDATLPGLSYDGVVNQIDCIETARHRTGKETLC